MVGGGGMAPKSFSKARPRLNRKPSWPAGAASWRAKGAPVLSKPTGKAKAAEKKRKDYAVRHPRQRSLRCTQASPTLQQCTAADLSRTGVGCECSLLKGLSFSGFKWDKWGAGNRNNW